MFVDLLQFYVLQEYTYVFTGILIQCKQSQRKLMAKQQQQQREIVLYSAQNLTVISNTIV